MLESIITGDNEDKRKQIEELTTALVTYTRPMDFKGSNSIEIGYDKQFENMCLLLSQKLNVDPKKFTVLEYYNAFEYIKKQKKKEKPK